MMCGRGHAWDDCNCPEELATKDVTWQTYTFLAVLFLVVAAGCLWGDALK